MIGYGVMDWVQGMLSEGGKIEYIVIEGITGDRKGKSKWRGIGKEVR